MHKVNLAADTCYVTLAPQFDIDLLLLTWKERKVFIDPVTNQKYSCLTDNWHVDPSVPTKYD